MKLLYCTECISIFSLNYNKKFCECGKSWGIYKENGLDAEYGGPSIPVGFNNNSFGDALSYQPEKDTGVGVRFEAFVIAKKCKTFKFNNKKWRKN